MTDDAQKATEALREQIVDVLVMHLAPFYRTADAVLAALDLPARDARDARVKAEALREAADKWQWGEWANAPRCADRVQERIANGQFVGDWLRGRADAIDGGHR